jgi:hypothetical protein
MSLKLFAKAVADTLAPVIQNQIESFISEFYLEIVSKNILSEEQLINIWESSNIKGIHLEVLIDKAKRKQKADEIRCKKMQEYSPCEYISTTGKSCKGHSKEIFEDKHYCTKHFKQISNKHTCVYIKKDGSICGSRIKTGQSPFEHDGHQYHGQYMCSTHLNIINKGIERENNRCSYTSKNGKQCQSQRIDGFDVCKKHNKDEKEKKSSEKREKNIKESKKNKDEKLPDIIIEINFNVKGKKPHSDLQFVNRKINDEIIFIDMNSGMVCHNPDNKSSTKPDNEQLVVIGVWDSETQSYGNITQECVKYAKAHKIKINDNE